eukprot:g43830.t1
MTAAYVMSRNVDLREYLSEEVQAIHKQTTYDLIGNVVHDGKPGEGAYRVHVLHHGTGKWYELQDLQVSDILPQMITLSEAYIQQGANSKLRGNSCFLPTYIRCSLTSFVPKQPEIIQPLFIAKLLHP